MDWIDHNHNCHPWVLMLILAHPHLSICANRKLCQQLVQQPNERRLPGAAASLCGSRTEISSHVNKSSHLICISVPVDDVQTRAAGCVIVARRTFREFATRLAKCIWICVCVCATNCTYTSFGKVFAILLFTEKKLNKTLYCPAVWLTIIDAHIFPHSSQSSSVLSSLCARAFILYLYINKCPINAANPQIASIYNACKSSGDNLVRSAE